MEYLDFCISSKKESFQPLSVDAIYYVFADSDYSIAHFAIENSLVFVATLSGQGTLLHKGRRITLDPGDMLIFDPSAEPFNYYCSSTSWYFWWFEFHCLSNDFLDVSIDIPFNSPLEDIHLELCAEALNRLKLRDNKTASILLSSLLCLLQKKSRSGANTRKGVALFQQADQYIRRNLATATVETTARHLGVSERTLLAVFQELLGIRTVEYINQIRMDMACHLLSSTENNVKGIAELLGYADQFVFSKSFHKWFGIPPSQYKKEHTILDTRKNK